MSILMLLLLDGQSQPDLHVEPGTVLFGRSLEGTGTKALFNTSRGAWRAGLVTSGQYWDPDSLGLYSAAFGENNLVKSSFGMSWGYENKCTGAEFSTAWGRNNKVESSLTTVWGAFNQVTGVTSTAWGTFNTATGSSSNVWGSGNVANSQLATVFGRYARMSALNSPSSWQSDDYLLAIGNGSSAANRKNALLLLKNGRLGLGDQYPVYTIDVKGDLNLRTTSPGDIVMWVDQDEALWYNGTYFSWGFGGSYNYFADDVRIGGSGGSAPTYNLFVDGTAGKIGTNTWDNPSDIRLKENITPFKEGLNELLEINPITFQYNEQSGFKSDESYVGIIAQELQRIAPYMVKKNEAGYLTANTSALAYMLVNAIKELDAENQALKRLMSDVLKKIEEMQ